MALPPLNDTIAAIATAPGTAAVGIVRVSGPASYAISDKIFQARYKTNKPLAAGRVIYGDIVDADTLIDEALLLTFRAPHSYTRQDVIEFQSHGGPAVLRKVLDLCQVHGARLAKPGEFTLRAFLNGRIDLLQAESVLHLVNAQSDGARRNAAMGLSKELSKALDSIQSDITGVYGSIQATLDYPEEGVPEAEFIPPLKRAFKMIEQLLATAKAGQLAQKGAKLALLGKPNVGKSSLLNALLGYQRSIVSDLPGTTRDYLEAPLMLDGIPITLVDTAGLRQTNDAIEEAGVELSKQIAQHADLSLFLLDASEVPTASDLAMLENLAPQTLIVANKIDLPTAWPLEDHIQKDYYRVSAMSKQGIEALKTGIHTALIGDVSSSEFWLSNERHAEALRLVQARLEQALTAPDDLAALDLEESLRILAELTGRGEIAEETLEHIFSQFCVGK